METQYAQIDQHRLAYQTAGSPDNPPLIMIHGLGSYKGVWENTIELCKNHFYCIAVDLLGFGESDKPWIADYKIATQAKRVTQLADYLDIDRFYLIGHSMGGQTAMYLSANVAPDRVIKLIDVSGVVAARLVRPTTVWGYFTRHNISLMMRTVPIVSSLSNYLAVNNQTYAHDLFSIWFYDVKGMPMDSYREARDMFTRTDGTISFGAAFRAINNANLTPILPKIKAPTLVIFGDSDAVVPVRDGYLAHERIPNSDLFLIEQGGHFVMYEHPDEYLGAVAEFLGIST